MIIPLPKIGDKAMYEIIFMPNTTYEWKRKIE